MTARVSGLSRAARSVIQAEGITVRQYVDHHYGPDTARWPGDRCGCTDDRCDGYHHIEGEPCPCVEHLARHAAAAIDVAREEAMVR